MKPIPFLRSRLEYKRKKNTEENAGFRESTTLPVSLIQEDDFVTARWESDFLLSEHFDFVADYVYTPEPRK